MSMEFNFRPINNLQCVVLVKMQNLIGTENCQKSPIYVTYLDDVLSI